MLDLTLTDGIMGIQWNMVDAGDEMAKDAKRVS